MNEIACPTFIDCNCPVTPFRNFSAELPDGADFFALAFVRMIPRMGDPNNFWGTTEIVADCSAPTQQEANDCALRRGMEGIADQWHEPDGTTIPLFGNSETHCVAECPNGDTTEYTVPAASFVYRTQAGADAIARSVCQTRVELQLACPPEVVTLAATNIAGTDATLNGTVNPNGDETFFYFEWGTTTAYGNVTPADVVPTGSSAVAVSADLTGLAPGTYHFRIVAQNNDGISVGDDVSFANAQRTIEIMDMDTINDLARDASVVAGSLLGVAAYWDGTTTKFQDTGAGGYFWAVSDSGQWITGGMFAGAGDSVTFDVDTETLYTIVVGNIEPEDINETTVLIQRQLFNSVTGALIGDTGAGHPGNTSIGPTPQNINNSNQVAMLSSIPNPGTFYRWTAGVSLAVTPPDYTTGVLSAFLVNTINDSGHVCAVYPNNLFQTRTFYYNGVASASIGAFGTGYVVATYFSNTNWICGQAENAALTVQQPFRWSPTVAISFLPAFTGMTPGATGAARCVNNDGNITGDWDGKAFIFVEADNATYPLTDYLPSGSGWDSLETAAFINNDNTVVGFGTHMGTPNTAYILTIPDL